MYIKLTWNKHIEYLINKTKYLVYIFYKMSKLLQSDLLKMLHFAFLCLVKQPPVTAEIERLQNRVLKIVHKNHFANKATPLNMQQMVAFQLIIFHYQSLQKQY